MKQHKLKVRLLSMLTALTMLASLFGAMPITASAADVSAASIKIGDYITLGGIKWRCVAFELATNQSNGYPVIDSTNTSTSYTVSSKGDQCYLPLMLADTSIGQKEFDAECSKTSGSHARNYYRGNHGSNYWGDSNIRDWLNSSASAGNVTWSCGNAPSYKSEAGFLTKFNDTEKAAMQTVTQKSLLAQADKDIPGASGSEVHTYNGDISNVVQNYSTAYSEQVTDTMFLLDVQQVYNVYSNDADLGGNGYYKCPGSECSYWLRMPSGTTSTKARLVTSEGGVGEEYADFSFLGWNSYHFVVRPAFFLNPSAKFVCGSGTSDVPYRLSHIIGTKWDENEHYTNCVYCGEEFSRGAHTYTADDSKRTCTKCGYSAKHTYDENHICTVCNHECSHSSETQYKTATEHYKVCTYCKRKTEPAPHKYINTGSKFSHYCEECDYSQSHSFGAYEIVSQPSSTADGVKKRTCSICGYEEITAFQKSQHVQNSAHNLCNDSECTIAGHKLPTSGTNSKWGGTNSTSKLNYSYGESPYTTYRLYNVINSGTTLTSVWEFPDYITEKKLYNCLDGTRLTLSDGAYIHIQSGETYSLTDCREGVGDIYGGTDGVIKVEKGGTFDFYEGTIMGNSGDGIIVNNGTMNLYGGTIMNNTGAAIINNGTLNIYGGTITNNTGGGIIGTGTINFKNVDCSTGNPVIANNTIDGKTCNIKGASEISVTALGEEASVGFTPAETVTPGTPVDISADGGEYYSHFVSDSDDYAIIRSDSKIQLIAAHSVLEHHEAKTATCTEDGYEEYWSCVDCNRLYSDKDGNTEIYAIPTTEATGHSITHREEVAPTCTESGTGGYWECTVCHKLFSDENGETEIAEIPTIDATGHRLTPHEAQAATCTESGNSAYWECMGCDKLFSDENGTTETTLENTVINATGHKWGEWTVKTPATETEDGEKLRTCSACNETETQVIPATGHTCDWGDWTITTAPTLTATGKAERVCKTNANHKDSVDLPILTDTTVWTYEETKAPTQDTDGEGKYTSVYGEIKITLPATGTGDTDKFSIRYEGGNAIVNAPTAGTYTVLFAAYDGGRLTSVTVQSVTVEKGETTVEPQGFAANGTVKVMLWESLSGMKPLCTAGE